MADDRTLRALPRVAELIAKADALLITAGAGMGVDSGLPDFRGKEGFWRAYPALGERGISFEQMAQPSWFFEEPETAWAFYGHRQQLYRETPPHDGFRRLLEWGRAMTAGYFVVTSNVDGAFEVAGFDSDRILEQHGSLNRYQCTEPCSPRIWTDDPPDLQIDLATLQAHGPLPRCPECGALARPNVLMFGDVAWVVDAMEAQRRRYQRWLASVRGRRVVILELGAGTAIATIRWIGEKLAGERSRTTLVRVNPDSTDEEEPIIPVRMTALMALESIEQKLPEGFRERCSVAATAKPRMSHEELWRRLDEGAKTDPGGIVSTLPAEHLQQIKFSKVYSKAWQVTLPSGWTAWVDRFDVHRTYLGFITGLPGTGEFQTEIKQAVAFVRRTFYGPEPVVIPPKIYDATSVQGIMPPLLFAAQIRSFEPISENDEGSWMNLIWFAEIDDDKSIRAFVEEALAQVDWNTQATGYDI